MSERGFKAAIKWVAKVSDEELHLIKQGINWPEKNCNRTGLQALKQRFEHAKKGGVTSESMQAMIDKNMSAVEQMEALSKKIDKNDEIIEDMYVTKIATMDAEVDRYGRYMTMAEKRECRRERLGLQKKVRVLHKDAAKCKETSKKQMRDIRHLIKVCTVVKRLFVVLEKL